VEGDALNDAGDVLGQAWRRWGGRGGHGRQ
jgi:hypothetical protein